jgi:hypothetical protein
MQQQHVFKYKQCKVNGDTARCQQHHADCGVTLPAAPLQVCQFLSKWGYYEIFFKEEVMLKFFFFKDHLVKKSQ